MTLMLSTWRHFIPSPMMPVAVAARLDHVLEELSCEELRCVCSRCGFALHSEDRTALYGEEKRRMHVNCAMVEMGVFL